MNGMLGVVKRSTWGSPTDISGRKTKLFGFVAKILVPFSKYVTFSLGLYSLIRDIGLIVWAFDFTNYTSDST